MARIVFAVMAALITIGAITACYNKPPQEHIPPAGIQR